MQVQQQYAGSLNLLSFKRILTAAVSDSVDVGSMWCVFDAVTFANKKEIWSYCDRSQNRTSVPRLATAYPRRSWQGQTAKCKSARRIFSNHNAEGMFGISSMHKS